MKICTYPECTCPFDMGEDNKCLLGHLSVRDAFIRFLKDAHALVEDGWYLHHRDAAVSVELAVVDKQWKAVLSDAGWMAKIS